MSSNILTRRHYDCIIIGAGISGINAAYHLNTKCKWASYTILERRSNLGGTWDLFKYPGIRSDSNMCTFGFSWKDWKSPQTLTQGKDILEYLNDAAAEQNITEKIEFNTNVKNVKWSTKDKCWYITTMNNISYSCNTILGCTGYYSYENPYSPTFKGEDKFCGKIVHAQNWSSEDNTSIIGKKVAIIGSGASAVTLLPNLSKTAEHVTLIQRTPSYIGNKPLIDQRAKWLLDWLPSRIASKIIRWRAIIWGFYFPFWCSLFPERAKKFIRKVGRKQIGNVMTDAEFDKHFTPPYNPWDQRFCPAMNGDFFKSIRNKKASIVTDHIESVTNKGIKMNSGHIIEVDFIVKATGLTFQPNFPFSTIEVLIDDKQYRPQDKMIYKGCMLSEVPNFAFMMGYLTTSWTLKLDITCSYFCSLLNYMRDNNYGIACPHIGTNMETTNENFVGLSSGYLHRALHLMPKQGKRHPWRTLQNFFVDTFNFWWAGINDDWLDFSPIDKKLH